MQKLRLFFERARFWRFCSKIGEKLNFPIDSNRYFSSTASLSYGFSVILYVIVAMMMKIRTY